MADNVVISHRGAAYEIGRGRSYYGIWLTGAPHTQPPEWWPPTPAGWSGAWSRFTRLEAPGTIVPVSADPILKISASTRAVIAALLLAAGVILGVAALFPGYLGRPSLASEASELVPHLIYLVTWAVSAVLIVLGGTRLRVGALLAAGVSAVTFGLYFADLGTASSGTNLLGAGLVLGLIGWLGCAAGAALAVSVRSPEVTAATAPGRRFELSPVGRLAAIAVAALGVAVAFAPAWDSYTLRTASGQSESLTAGNAFANPAAVIAGDVIVMAVLVAVLVVAALLRPVRYGAVLLIGAVIPMAAQAISAGIQLGEAATPSQFGISAAQARAAGLTISSGATAAFWVYCAFIVALLVLAARMLLPGRPGAPTPAAAPWAPAAGPVPVPAPMTSVVPGAVLPASAPAYGAPAGGRPAVGTAGTARPAAPSGSSYGAGQRTAGGPEQAAPESAGSEAAGSEAAGSEAAGPEAAGSEAAGSEAAGLDPAGPDAAGTGRGSDWS